jgi:hypothetical protein
MKIAFYKGNGFARIVQLLPGQQVDTGGPPQEGQAEQPKQPASAGFFI